MRQQFTALFVSLIALSACSDAPATTAPDAAADNPLVSASVYGEHRSTTPTSAVRWNRKAVSFFRARGGNPGRALTYVSLAQYRAVLAAKQARTHSSRPSLAGAAAGASVVILKQFYPLDAAAIDAELLLQRSTPAGDNDADDAEEFAAGEAIGRAIAATVLTQAAADQFGLTDPGPAPIGAGFWVSSPAAPVRGNLGARPFFLRSGSELRSAPPPSFGSPAFLAALTETRTLAQNRTPEQLAIVQKWVPFSDVVFNGVASDLIDKYRRSEVEASAIFAYLNTAAFDAIVGCFDAKYHYWYIRPTQADPSISLGTGLPNHPSYPSGHSCQTGALQGILTVAFPRERTALSALATEASTSRLIGGLHYRFDADAGLTLGRSAALLAILRRGIE
jgi:hypothetical protein